MIGEKLNERKSEIKNEKKNQPASALDNPSTSMLALRLGS